jgi:hypothetical protein
VVNEEPVPPRQLQPKTPRDLETICLKCLAKESRRRYPTAEELAKDLRRFLEGKPIEARPVSRLERVGKWAHRNPAVAGLLAAVALVLLGGIAVSTYFAVAEAHQAELASNNEVAALKAKAELENANEELLTTAARSLIRPIGLQIGRWPLSELLTIPEEEAFWELACHRDNRLRYRFVKEALRGPVTTRQLKNRAEFALHAALGLRESQRAEVQRIIIRQLQNPKVEQGTAPIWRWLRQG